MLLFALLGLLATFFGAANALPVPVSSEANPAVERYVSPSQNPLILPAHNRRNPYESVLANGIPSYSRDFNLKACLFSWDLEAGYCDPTDTDAYRKWLYVP